MDIARLKKGKVGGSFWVAYVPCPSESDNFSDSIYVPGKLIREKLKLAPILHTKILSFELMKVFLHSGIHSDRMSLGTDCVQSLPKLLNR